MEKMIDYLPSFMQEYPAIQAICDAEEPEFTTFEVANTQVASNLLINTSSEARIYDIEQLLDVVPATTMPLSERKNRLLNYLRQPPNYTLRRVIKDITKASLSGTISHEVVFSQYLFKLHCDLPEPEWTIYHKKLQEMIPANIILEVTNDPTHIIHGECFVAGKITRDFYRRID